MSDTTADPWQTGRPWQIVRADLDLAHVFLPLNQFFFQPTTAQGRLQGYTITHPYQAPQPDCFSCSFLVPVRHQPAPAFEKIADRKTLPLYNSDSATTYADVSAMIVAHMRTRTGK